MLSPRYPPVDELVFTVLSQNTADVNTERTFASLKARFPEWTAARDASAEEIEEAIALGGLAHTKAPRIKRILEAISARTGAPDLGELDGMTDEEAQAYLVALPGVGPKTAACVLLFALERPVMPVDTHVHRVARRLGIIDEKVTADQAHPLLTELAGAGRRGAGLRRARGLRAARPPHLPRPAAGLRRVPAGGDVPVGRARLTSAGPAAAQASRRPPRGLPPRAFAHTLPGSSAVPSQRSSRWVFHTSRQSWLHDEREPEQHEVLPHRQRA